jgi:vacuolar protein sorting-associated protein 1
MDQLIKTVNRLQDAFASVGVATPIDLPQIVVIGRYLLINMIKLLI